MYSKARNTESLCVIVKYECAAMDLRLEMQFDEMHIEITLQSSDFQMIIIYSLILRLSICYNLHTYTGGSRD